MVKRYFPVQNKTRVRLPQDFIDSKNKKYIYVIDFQTSEQYSEGYRPFLLSLHSNLVQKDPYCDHLIRFSTGSRTDIDRLKYEQIDDIEFLDFWFKYPDGSKCNYTEIEDVLEKDVKITDPDGNQKIIHQRIKTGEKSIDVKLFPKLCTFVMLMLEYEP